MQRPQSIIKEVPAGAACDRLIIDFPIDVIEDLARIGQGTLLGERAGSLGFAESFLIDRGSLLFGEDALLHQLVAMNGNGIVLTLVLFDFFLGAIALSLWLVVLRV